LNLARAYELNGQKHHAVNSLQTFLTRVPNSSEENQIKRRIDKLQEQIDSEAALAPATPPPTTQTPPPTAPVAPAAATQATETPEPSSGGHRPILPLIVGGVGAAMFIAGGIVWLGANSDIKDFEKKCPGRTCTDHDQSTDPPTPLDEAQQAALTQQGNDIITRRDVSGVIALVGIGAMVGGGIWYALSKPSGGSASATPRGFTARVTPAMAPGYGGMSLVGAF
jgi:hypothetical protein